MKTDIVSAEVELSVAVNQIERYADFLAESIQSYIRILSQLQENGIHDDMVCARLSEIAFAVHPAIQDLTDQSDMIRSRISAFISEVEKVDNFAFPSGIVSMLKSLLAQLI